MAIANYEAMNKLFNEGDYNVRVTFGRSENQTDEAFKELFRDSLGHGMLDSDEMMSFSISGVTYKGEVMRDAGRLKGKELLYVLTTCKWFDNCIAIRIDWSKNTSKRTWIIVR